VGKYVDRTPLSIRKKEASPIIIKKRGGSCSREAREGGRRVQREGVLLSVRETGKKKKKEKERRGK